MNPSDKKNTDQLIELTSERDRIGDFERQLLDRERGNLPRKGITLNAIFEKAGLKKIEWVNVPIQFHPFIMRAAEQGVPGVGAKPWETDQGQMIFGNTAKNTYYLVKESDKNFAWTRFWMEDEKLHNDPLGENATLSRVIEIVAAHEFGKKHEAKAEIAEKAREKARESLRHWEQK